MIAPATIGQRARNGSRLEVRAGAYPKTVRCALYVRKSTEEGLDQAFNSLDAQRLACEEYVRTRAGEGWAVLPEHYTDGGWSGATVKRPAFQRLLSDIEARKVDCVVVHRVDRLSRSLLDFARLMAFFQEHGVAFVSVTQNFSTADPVGRLTLNLLATFSEFEREMIVARTRDKVAAARRKGRWTGGMPVLGYDVDPRGGRLQVNEDEAVLVREIFRIYLEAPSLTKVVEELSRRGWRRKTWTRKDGVLREGSAFDKPSLLRLLRNPLYAGKVHHCGSLHPGEHSAIVDETTWENVQALITRNAETGGGEVRNRHGALLRGVLRCASCGCAMSHTFTRNRSGIRYRYYTCQTRLKRGAHACPDGTVPAHEVERQVVERIRAIGRDPELVAETARQARVQIDERRALLDAERRQITRDLGHAKTALRQLAKSPNGNGHVAAEHGEVTARARTIEARLAAVDAEVGALDTLRIDEADVARALAQFDGVWDSPWPAERTRILSLLLEGISYDGREKRLAIRFRTDGIGVIAANGTT
jgi:site-specific DNA recombinase